MGLTALLTLSVILITVAEQMPKNPQQFPILGLLLLDQVLFIALGTVASVTLMHIEAGWKHAAMTRQMQSVLNGGSMKNNAKKMRYDEAAIVRQCYTLDLVCMMLFMLVDTASVIVILCAV